MVHDLVYRNSIENFLHSYGMLLMDTNFLFYTASIFSLYLARRIIFRHIWYTPGVGTVSSRRNRKTKCHELTVESEIGKIKIPSLRLPGACDIEIFLFSKPLSKKSGPVSRQEFEEKYSSLEYSPLQRFGDNFVIETFHTNQVKAKKVSGWIRSLTSFNVYIFTVENNFIDYSQLVQDYLSCNDGSETVSLEDL